MADLRFPTRKEEKQAESETEPENWEAELEEVPVPPRQGEPEHGKCKQQAELVITEKELKPDLRIVVLKPETIERDFRRYMAPPRIPGTPPTDDEIEKAEKAGPTLEEAETDDETESESESNYDTAPES